MSGLLVKEKSVVVPGEKLAAGMDYLPADGTYRKGEEIRAGRLGLVNLSGRAIKIIPLAGAYLPKKGDNVIGRVVDITMNGWRIEMNCAYSAMLTVKDASSDYIPKGADLRKYFDIGDYMVARIVQVTSQNLIDVSTKGPGLRKLRGGRIFKINPTKVPRIIGKNGSMVSMIKDATGCRITVGQNGLIWIDGEPDMEQLAHDTITRIETESHIPGLTETINQHLIKEVEKIQKQREQTQNK